MDKFRGTAAMLIFWFIIFFPQIPCTAGDHGGQHSEKEDHPPPPSLLDMILHELSSPAPFVDKLKGFVKIVQKRYFPPNLDFRRRDEAAFGSGGGGGGTGAGGRIKAAVERSFGASKETVEESAKSAAKAVGDAVHKTADKMKESMSDGDGSHDDL